MTMGRATPPAASAPAQSSACASASTKSLVSQSNHGVDAHSPARREKRSDSGYEKHQANCNTKAQRVGWLHSPDGAAKYLRRWNNRAQAQRYADTNDPYHLPEHRPEYVASFRTQSHADADFARPFRCRM